MSAGGEHPAGPVISRLVGVYNADGSIRGELTYWVGARFGRRHCALCDITHGLVRERAEWRLGRADLAVRFDTYHRDDQPDAVRAATGDRAPAVLAETGDGLVPLLGAEALDRCGGSVERLVEAVIDAVDRDGLVWPNTG